MRVTLFTCAFISLSFGQLFAQSFSDVIPADQRQFDFGAVPKTSKSEHKFPLFNPFQTDIHIQGVRASCGCTTPIVETKVIKPGETGYLTAKFNTDRFNGEKKATLTVTITKPYFTELQFNVRGYIRTDIVLNPGEVAFGSIAEGAPAKLKLELNYAGRQDWKIQDIVCPYSFLTANFQELSRSNGRVQYSIEVDLNATAPEGHLQNQIVIHTNDHRLKTFPIRFSVNVEKPIQIAPPRLALNSVKPNETITQRLTISAKTNFQITAINSEVADIAFEPTGKSSRIHMLQLVINPRAPAEFAEGEVNGFVLVQTDIGDSPIKIPISFSIESDKLADSQ